MEVQEVNELKVCQRWIIMLGEQVCRIKVDNISSSKFGLIMGFY